MPCSPVLRAAKVVDENEPVQPRYYAGDDAKAYWYSATDSPDRPRLQAVAGRGQNTLSSFHFCFNPNDRERCSPDRGHAGTVTPGYGRELGKFSPMP